MSIFDLYDALADHLGYVLPRVNAPTPEGARRPQVLTDSRVSPFLARVISGEQLARANDKAAPAGLKGWWGSQSLPETKDPKIRQEWGELLAAGRLADLAFWHEAWCQEALPAQLTARLIAFQTRHTVLQDGDACPAPWGAVGAQAAVALYNLYHLIEARAAGVADGGLQEVAGQLTEWLTKVPTFSTPVSGDLILLDLFSQDLERKSFEYDQQLERLGLELRQAREARSQALAAHARLRWWPGAAASRRKRREAWRVVATQCRELEAREAWQKIAVKHLTDLRIAWQRLSPLTGLRLRANAAPTAATPSPPPEVADPSSSDPARFTLLPIAVDPAAEGLQHWVAIRMAERCALSRLANPLPSPVAALFRTASVQVNSDDEEAWRLRRFLLLFYFHWSLRAGTLSRIGLEYPYCPEAMRPASAELFGAWRRLNQALDHLKRLPRRPAAQLAYEELVRLQDSTGTLEWWEGRPIESHAARLAVLQERFLSQEQREAGEHPPERDRK